MIALVVALTVAGAPTVYVQASKLKLRTRPSTDAPVVVEVPIASACTVVTDGPPWVKLDCGGKIGFTKFELVGDSPPKLADQIALAENHAMPAADRLTGAQRALALSSTDKTRALLRSTFIDAEHALLAGWRDFETMELECRESALAACVSADLARAGMRAMVDVRGTSFVSAAAPREGGELFFTRGIERSRAKDAESGLTLVRMDVARARSPRDDAFESAVLAGAGAPAAPVGTSVLAREQRKQLAGLPLRWLALEGAAGARYVQRNCEASTPSKRIVVGVLGDVALVEDVGQETISHAITAIARDKSGVDLTLDGGDRLTLAWPTAEKGVGTWGTDAYAADGAAFPVKADADDCAR